MKVTDFIRALFSPKHRRYLNYVDEIVLMRKDRVSFRKIAKTLKISVLDVKRFYYQSLGLEYIQDISNMSVCPILKSLPKKVQSALLHVGIDSDQGVAAFVSKAPTYKTSAELLTKIDRIGLESAMAIVSTVYRIDMSIFDDSDNNSVAMENTNTNNKIEFVMSEAPDFEMVKPDPVCRNYSNCQRQNADSGCLLDFSLPTDNEEGSSLTV